MIAKNHLTIIWRFDPAVFAVGGAPSLQIPYSSTEPRPSALIVAFVK